MLGWLCCRKGGKFLCVLEERAGSLKGRAAHGLGKNYSSFPAPPGRGVDVSSILCASSTTVIFNWAFCLRAV